MPRPQFTLKTMLAMITAACAFAALVGSVPAAESRIAIAIVVPLALAPLCSALVLFTHCGRSRWLSVAAWLVALISLVITCGFVGLAAWQEV